MNRKLGLLTLLGVLASACGGVTGAPRLTVSARAGRASLSAAPADAAAAGTPTSAGLALPNGIVITRVRMAIRRIELADESGGDGSGPGGGSHGIEIERGPFEIDLAGAALDGGIHQLFEVSVPAGTYDEVKFEIHHLEGGQSVGDPELDSGRASVVVDGTIDGAAFTFASRLNDEQRHEGPFDVSAEEGAGSSAIHNVTLNIDPGGWFGSAARLDPRLAADQQAIEENIRRSIDVYGDDDHDGEDDHRGRGRDGAPDDDLGGDRGGRR